jgi:hypothetical protein
MQQPATAEEEPNRVIEIPDYDPTNIAHLDHYDRVLNVYLMDWEMDHAQQNAKYVVCMRGILVGQTPEDIAEVGYLHDFALANMDMLKTAREMYLRGQGQRKRPKGYRQGRHKTGKLWIQTMHKHVGLPPTEGSDPLPREAWEMPKQKKKEASPMQKEEAFDKDVTCMMQ